MATEATRAGAKPLSWWWGIVLLALAAAAWWLQPPRAGTSRAGKVERILLPIEANRFIPDGRVGSYVSLSGDARVARAISRGVVIRSETLGATWHRETFLPASPGASATLGNVAQSWDGRRAIAVGRNGLIITTADDGATWVERDSEATWDLGSVVMSADGMRAIATSLKADRILRTEDGGITWFIQLASVSSVSLAANGLTGLAIGAGRLLRTVDGGASWSDVTARLGAGIQILRVALAADGRRAMAVTSSGDILRSRDGGATWDSVAMRLGGFQVHHIALSADGWHAILSGRDTLMTSDGGGTWMPVPGSPPSSSAVLSADGSEAIVLGDGEAGIWSRDAGRSWQRMAPAWREPALWTVVGLGAVTLLLTSAWQRWQRQSRRDSRGMFSPAVAPVRVAGTRRRQVR